MSAFDEDNSLAEEDKASQEVDPGQDSEDAEALISQTLAYLDKEKLYGRYEVDTSDEEEEIVRDYNVCQETKGLEDHEEGLESDDENAFNSYRKLEEDEAFGDFQGFASEPMEATMEGYVQTMRGSEAEMEEVEYTTVAMDSPISPANRDVSRSLPPLSAGMSSTTLSPFYKTFYALFICVYLQKRSRSSSRRCLGSRSSPPPWPLVGTATTDNTSS
ncbi:hypothetical protein EON65_49985 [archaeon]|nr:MAG: hypothetical protein EON65_49985 [archaeon]